MVDPFGVLGLIGTIDTTYHWGKELVALCKASANAEARLHESVVRVEACWLKIQIQLEFVRRLEPQLSEWHKNIQQQTLEVLLHKLQAANTKLSGLVKKSNALPNDAGEEIIIVEVKRPKYAFVKESLMEAITDLEVWQGIFDPSWFLMMKIAGPEVDQQLYFMSQQQSVSTHKGTKAAIPAAQHLRLALKPVDDDSTKKTVYLLPDGLITESVQPLPYSPVRIARRATTGQLVVLDPITCTSRASINSALRDIRNFARRLQQTDPFTFGLLQCKGILSEEDSNDTDVKIRNVAPASLSFVFRMPPTHSYVQSLRHRLLSGPSGEHSSLTARFDLARQLVKAVSYVHLYEFVHKNIRPETILILSNGSHVSIDAGGDEKAGAYSETAVLVGFDVLRDAEGKTHRLGDDDWEKNLYRHPHRQGKTPETDYNMRHDIYSVGVCLLEVGLWESFIEYDNVNAKEQEALKQISLETTNLRLSSLVKDRLLQLARGVLRRKMGIKYSKVVETCLTCLDPNNEDFGDEKEFQDMDGVAEGVRYIEKVVQRLGEISV
ncbi:uncharacterized protein TRIVIDRAFT_144969 [Trichoderma virens Gv29-8]|uniref:Protein kinase domain-containing protein n=1 Tax=Hypocrea virens (strain Gv29-8 / FGSC 10586) TaxID=413071 RepID=G9MKC7_HYPVG|nr:uncharacterized protein TRIVIDRAFT_144969 [Trichoderma virens Gv29-8]EHK25102.1 hypothetical protein TRIVIDRAFT_144969 [Trichoderma virens Gv29-8]UKZ49073.1 hypothetical protein TrVGV298_003312 [Trichoderma virens]